MILHPFDRLSFGCHAGLKHDEIENTAFIAGLEIAEYAFFVIDAQRSVCAIAHFFSAIAGECGFAGNEDLNNSTEVLYEICRHVIALIIARQKGATRSHGLEALFGCTALGRQGRLRYLSEFFYQTAPCNCVHYKTIAVAFVFYVHF